MNNLSDEELANLDDSWVDPNDNVPQHEEIVEVITDNGYETIAQFHVGQATQLPTGEIIIKKHPMFGWINPDDYKTKAVIFRWRPIEL